MSPLIINPRRACAARVTVVVLCVCVCVRGPHLQLAQLSDKVGILAVSVSCSLVFKCGVFRFLAKVYIWRASNIVFPSLSLQSLPRPQPILPRPKPSGIPTPSRSKISKTSPRPKEPLTLTQNHFHFDTTFFHLFTSRTVCVLLTDRFCSCLPFQAWQWQSSAVVMRIAGTFPNH